MKIFIGWDSREDIAYQVARHSILSRSNSEVEVFPIKKQALEDLNLYHRPHDNLGSTEFTISRFFVPFLSGYHGWSLFIDCDFLIKVDIKELFDLADDRYAVMCAKHDYTPKEEIKMDSQAQHQYPRKNWSSCVLWNCGHPSNRMLTPGLINRQSGAFLHRFQWLEDSNIGEFSHEYNWLEGWYKEPQDGTPKIIHYTRGGPWFDAEKYPEWQNVDYAQDWINELKSYQQN